MDPVTTTTLQYQTASEWLHVSAALPLIVFVVAGLVAVLHIHRRRRRGPS